MLRFLFGLAVAVAFAAFVALVPLHGRTVLDRWHASRGARDFLVRGYQEVKVAAGLEAEKPRPARSQPARPARPPPRPAHRSAPTEQHSEADRAAIDRIVTEHAGR